MFKGYSHTKKYQKEALEYVEKIGDLLSQLDEINNNLRFYAIEVEKDFILDIAHNFSFGKDYGIWRDSLYHRLNNNGKIVRVSDEWINKVKESEKIK